MSMIPLVEASALALGPLAAAVHAGTLPGMPPRPRRVSDWRDRAVGVRTPALGAEWVRLLGAAFDAEGHAATALARVAGGQGLVVTTGQQPGLFGGPAYTLIKAVSAQALADRLEEALGIPCIAVFWAATDDADFAEGASTQLPAGDGVLTASLEAVPGHEGRMLSRVPVQGTAEALAVLQRAAGGAAWPEPVRDAIAAYGAPGATVGGAYVRLMRQLLAPLGIPVLDASHAVVRAVAAPMLRRALERAEAIDSALRTRASALGGLGFTPQVELLEDRTLVFRVGDDGSKVRVPVREAAATLATGADLSPNVLLRPVIERALLPTMAYVGGPGELAYFAQVAAVAEALGAPQPLAVPRASVRVVPPSVSRTLARLGATLEELRVPAELEGRLARAATSAAALDALAALRASTRMVQQALSAAGTALPTPAIDGSVRQLQWRVDRLERRLLAATKRQETDVMRRLHGARALLWPHGGAQERAVNPLPWLARYGPPLREALQQAVAAPMRALVHDD